MRKFKLFTLIGVALLASVVFTACSCSKKKDIKPQTITTPNISAGYIFVGDIINVSYTVLPYNSTNVEVTAVTTNAEVVVLSTTNFVGTSGVAQVTAMGIGSADIVFTINGTRLRAQTSITVSPDPVELTAPENLTYNYETQSIEFDKVENASSYELLVNGDKTIVVPATTSSTVSYKIFEGENALLKNTINTVMVKAIGDNYEYLDSGYGEYETQPVRFLQLDTIENLAVVNGVVTWNAHPLKIATIENDVENEDDVENEIEEIIINYQIELNGEIVNVTDTESYVIPVIESKIYSVRVKALMISDNEIFSDYYDSVWSSVVTTQKLNNVEGIKLINNIVVDQITQNSKITWSQNILASGYEVVVTNLQGQTINITADEKQNREINVDSRFVAGQYSVKIMALGNGVSTLNSDFGSGITFVKASEISLPQISNNIFSFEAINLDTTIRYELILINNDFKIIKTLSGNYIDLINQLTNVGTYKIFVRTIPNHVDGILYANSDLFDTGLEFTQLSSPEIYNIDNTATISFSLIDGASSYAIYIDNVKVHEYFETGNELDNVAYYKALNVAGGNHVIKIVAVGNGSDTVTANSTQAKEYSFKKLNDINVTSFKVENSIVSWQNIDDAINYLVKVNNQPEFLTGGINSFVINTTETSNTIKVVAVGNNRTIISSNSTNYQVVKLPTPTGLKVVEGKLSWDNNSQNVFYKVYLNNVEMAELNQGELYDFSGIQEEVDYEFSVVAYPTTTTINNYIHSERATININKLNTANNITTIRVDDTQKYELRFDAVLNARKYLISITTTDVENFAILPKTIETTTNYFEIPDTWKSGKYSIRVFAIGSETVDSSASGIGYLNSESSVVYSFVKLKAVTNIVVSGNEIVWIQSPSVAGQMPIKYQIDISTPTYNKSITTVGADTRYVFDEIGGKYSVKIKAIGADSDLLSSEWSKDFNISRLNVVTGITINSIGGISFTDYNLQYNTSLNTTYDIYLKRNGSNTMELLVSNYTHNNYIIEADIEKDVVHELYIVAKDDAYIISQYSKIDFVKLNDIVDFDITNKTFMWGIDSKSTKYEIFDVNANQTLITTIDSLQNEILFEENSQGIYEYRIRSIGGVVNGINYITGDYSQPLRVVVLKPVGNIFVEEGNLHWRHSYTTDEEMPTEYEISFYEIINGIENEDATLILTALANQNVVKLNALPTGEFSVKIKSVGNNKEKIDSQYATSTGIIKLNANDLKITTTKGVVTWSTFSGAMVRYELYIKEKYTTEDAKLIANITNGTTSYVIPNNLLVPLKEYEFSIKVFAQGLITSGTSQPITIVKLPQIKNFKINKDLNNFDSPHYFSWTRILQSEIEIASGYEILPLTLMPEYNVGIVSKGVETLTYDYFNPGNYNFKIRAVGSTYDSENNDQIHYLNSEYSQEITVVVLDNVKFDQVAVRDNLLHYNPSSLFVDSDTNPDEYRIEVWKVVSEQETEMIGQPITISSQVYTKSFDPNEYDAGQYIIKIYSIGTKEYKINSEPAVYKNLLILKQPENIKVSDGFVEFDNSDSAGYEVFYEIYNGSLLLTTLNSNELSQTKTINDLIADFESLQHIKIRAVATDAIYSKFSNTLKIIKLAIPSNFAIKTVNNVSGLFWTDVENSSKYRIYVDKPEVFVDHELFDNEKGYFEVSTSGSIGITIPRDLAVGTLNFKIMAIGSTILSDEYENLSYLSSNLSASVTTNIMDTVKNLKVSNGVIVWSSAEGAILYRIALTNKLTKEVFNYEQTQTSIDLNSAGLIAGDYTVKVSAIGDNISYISSNNYTEIDITKNNKPEAFSIVNGLLSWRISANTILDYMYGKNSGKSLSVGDEIALMSLFKGDEANTHGAVVNNLYPLYNLELSVGSLRYRIKASEVLSLSNGNYQLFYDLNIVSGLYEVRVRGLGNSTDASINESGNMLSGMVDGQYTLFNYVHTSYSDYLSVFKLPVPITPPTIDRPAIEGNVFRFKTISQTKDYYIIAIPNDANYNTIIHSMYTTSATGEILITDIVDDYTGSGMVEGVMYRVMVRAKGTVSSALANQPYLLLSNSSNSVEVQLLLTPTTLSVLNGKLLFNLNLHADSHELKISSILHNISETIIIGKDIYDNEEELNKLFVYKLEDGQYVYDFENNPLFTHSISYEVTIRAIGDTIKFINSKVKEPIYVVKWIDVALDGVGQDIVLENGAFKWKKSVYINPINQEILSPEAYKVKVIRTDANFENEFILEDLYIVGSQFSASNVIRYELPDDENFVAQYTENGISYNYLYKIQVSAFGSYIVEENMINFVTSNSLNSETKRRLSTPQALTTTDGVLNWQKSNSAGAYEVMIDGYEVEDVLNTLSFEMAQKYTPGVYNLKVRAKSTGDNYINSRATNSIKIVKYDNPVLRIDAGEIKWNNTTLPYSISEKVLLEISTLSGFTPDLLSGFSLNDFNYNADTNVYSIILSGGHVANTLSGFNFKGAPVGLYTINVKYVGSTGIKTVENESYYIASSDKSSITFNKLSAPEIAPKTDVIDERAYNLITWNAIENATNYNVVVFKETDNGIYSFKFAYSDINYGTKYFYYYSDENKYAFNLNAVVVEHDNNSNNLIKFGGEYGVYVEAYSSNSSYQDMGSKYSMSDNSNVLNITIPLTPTNLNLDNYGVVTWKNESEKATPVLRYKYKVAGALIDDWVIVELQPGQTSYNLKEISDEYVIQIQSIIGDSDATFSQSDFSGEFKGFFKLFTAGNGSELSPYIITNAKDLHNISYYPNSYYRLNNDINISLYADYTNWHPIGLTDGNRITTTPFNGQLNGNGFRIYDISFSGVNSEFAGFIHTIGVDGKVYDLSININSTGFTSKYFGGVAVYNYGTIENVLVTGVATILQQQPNIYMAGVAVYNYEGALITNTVNLATIKSNSAANIYSTYIGGIVYQNNGTISKAGNRGVLEATSIGGIAFRNTGIITEAYNTGTMKSLTNENYTDYIFIGGIASMNEGQITYSYVQLFEKISVESIVISGMRNVNIAIGGIVGSNSGSGSIASTYSMYKLGTVSGRTIITQGSIIGSSSSAIYSKLYYNQTSGQKPVGNDSNTVANITPKSDAEMKGTNFVNQDLSSTYFQHVVNSYPILKWETNFYWNSSI